MISQVNTTEQYFPAVLFVMLYKVGFVQGSSNFESVDETLKCDHSNQSYGAVFSSGAVHYAVQGGSNISESTHKILFVLVSLELKTIKQ